MATVWLCRVSAVSFSESSEWPLKWPASCAATTRPLTAAPAGIATYPSATTSCVTTPLNGVPSCVTALSSPCVMRTGIEAPTGSVTSWKAGGGGPGAFSLGGGSGWLFAMAVCSCGVVWRGAVGALGEVTVGGTGMPATVRPFTTSFTPFTLAASSAATELAVSSLTSPVRVTTPACTDV